MTEQKELPTTERDEAASDDSVWQSRLSFVVWAGVSLVFLVAIAFGSVEARIWTLGRLTFRERGIAHVWHYFGERLPDMPGGPLFSVLYYLSLAVMVLGTIAGLGLFLLTDDEDTPIASPESSASHIPNE